MTNFATLFKPYRAFLFALFTLIAAGQMARAAEPEWHLLVNPGNSFAFYILKGDKIVLNAGTGGWGPNWAWFPLESHDKAVGDQLNVSGVMAIGKQKPTIGLKVQSVAANQFSFEYELQTQTDVPVLQIISTFDPPAGKHCKAVLTKVDGTQATIDLPMNPSEFGVINKIAITSDLWDGAINLALDPPIFVGGHGSMRIALAKDILKTGSTKQKITWTLPGDCSLLLKESDVAKFSPVLTTPDWFSYLPKWTAGKSVIGFEDWLDKPAGKHGGVRMQGDHFQFEDGSPVKFWGTNLAYGLSAPTKANADFTAARFAKYGVNAVRMHKFTGSGWAGIGDEADATKMTPAGLDRLDYFSNQLAKNGVYYGWSHTYHFTIKPGNKSRISGYEELMKKGGDTYAVINWAEDVQDLMIESVVNLLKHKNPYTDKTYAEDPALAYIELQNEDDIFFYTTGGAINEYPTYLKQLQGHFAEWLTSKYGTEEKLAAAWGDALKGSESLAKANFSIEGNPYFYSEGPLAQLAGGKRQRMLDAAAFLHFTQNKFYSKFVKAIRDAGYQGPLVGSPWQAPAMLPHYYNLRSDDLVGYIDRHNYFEGGFTATMLKTPGGGYLSSGLQQVAGRPFGISEWIHNYPSLYSAEGPVLMAAYGFGLQGWAASYEFQSTSNAIDAAGQIVGAPPWGIWNADVPTQIGQYPILARMIMRGDVTTAPVISTRRVSPQDLESGKFNFSDTVNQQGDVKTFTGSVPAEALAAGRDLVEFVDKTTPSTFCDMSKYTQGKVITSVTGQLKWDAGDGVVTIDTPGTQGYVGFAQGKSLALGDVTIQPATPYASILLTAADVKGSLASDGRVLISAVARNSNKGFRIVSVDNHTIVDNGKGPIMLEPVKADITFAKRKIKQVNILDQDGNASERTIPVVNGKFTIDGAQDHAIYYEVLFD